MPAYAYALVAIGWLVWFTPFVVAKRNAKPAEKVDRRARWGMLLQGVAYWILWWSPFWTRSPANWRVALSILFFLAASLLSWTSVRYLGRQWRFDAGLSADHQLVRSGPYRFLRHPIYTSMLCVLCGTGFMVTPLWLLLLAILLFLIGAEIRVRVEDALLASRFGDEFRYYQRTVSAYVPFLKLRR